jgi:hypothetical protein
MENDSNIPYGTMSEFEMQRRKILEENQARAAAKAETSMLPQSTAEGNAKSDTVLPSSSGSPFPTPEGLAALINPQSIQDDRKKAATMYEEVAKGAVTGAEDEIKQYDADQAALGERGTEREAGLRKQQGELEGKEDKNFNMAIIEAGLAMMSGNSANAFENIGKGALVGTKAYKDGQEKLQARKDKLDEAIFALEDSRFSDKKVDAATKRALNKDVTIAKTNVKKVLADAYMDANVTVATAVQNKVVDMHSANTRSVYEQQQAGIRAREGDKAAMARVVAGRSALEEAGKAALDNFTKENPNATAEEQLAFIAKLSKSTYAATETKQAALNVSIVDKVNDATARQARQANSMAEGPKKVEALRVLDVLKAKLKKEYEAEAGAGGGSGSGEVDLNNSLLK